MIQALATLSTEVLEALEGALRGGALRLPCTAADVQHLTPDGDAGDVASALSALGGATDSHRAANVLALLVADRARAAAQVPSVDLVWSGPEAPASLNRDTGVVIRELLERAQRRVLIATFVLDEGEKARAILAPLAARLDRGDPLDVRIFANIQPDREHHRPASDLVAAFGERFRTRIWPGTRVPRLFYDPRSLDTSGSTRASLHAKCVVIDESIALVTSANFTQAAQWRNIEVGLVVEGTSLAQSLSAQFGNLVQNGSLREVPLPGGPGVGGT